MREFAGYHIGRCGDVAAPQGAWARWQKPADRPWGQLAERLRDNNRDQADHREVKLAILGLQASELVERARDVRSGRSSSALPLDDAAIELLAQVEHRRWLASSALSGYAYAPDRDEKKRHHPDMVPYAELDERTKQFDRDVIANLPGDLLNLEETHGGPPES